MKHVLLSLLFVAGSLAGCLSEDSPDTDEPMGPAVEGGGQKATVGGANATTGESVEATAVPEGDYDFSGPYARLLEDGPLGIVGPERVTLPSDIDGADISMALWKPEGDGPFPVFMFSSPYFTENELGAAFPLNRPIDDPGGAVQVLIEEFVPHGYAFLTHAVRGTATSGACNDLMGPLETADIDQAVTWAGTQAWSNGKVAMTGVSYDGSTPWAAASTGNPHLATIIPISGVPDMHGLMYRNGSSESRGPLVLNGLYIGLGAASGPIVEAPGRIVCPDALQGLALSGVAGVTGEDPTGWWQERNRKPDVEANYQGSIFSVQGLQDWNVDPTQVIPWVDDMDKMGFKTKQLLGQWGHAWPDGIGVDGVNTPLYRADYKEILLAWLDQELKGEDRDTGAPVQIMDSLGRWRNEAHFPPRDAEWTTYHLTAAGRLDVDGAGEASSIILLPNTVPLPLPEARDQPVAIGQYSDFVMAAGQDDILVSGLPRVHVTVTPHGPGGYIAAYLYERDGTELNRLAWTSMNLRYAAGGTEPQEVIPGMPLKVNMELQPLDGVIRSGNQLVLRLWVFTDGDRLPTLPGTGVNLELGHAMESVLHLPTIERDESVYFSAPTPEEDADSDA